MRWKSLSTVWKEQDAAVAPTMALTLFALIGIGGVAFDYARLATLDSELQNAADQAALAGASQLDGQSNACSRAATTAASHLSGNRTLMANEVASRVINIQTEATCDAVGKIKFWQNAAKTTAANSAANARYIEVTVDDRTAKYALTPVIEAFTSPAIAATALAGLGSAICKVPPVMICNPQETGGSTTFDASLLLNKGLKLVSVGANGGWSPGNFGYLNSGGGSNGAPGLREALGWVTPPGDCIEQTGVDTKPGATVDVTDSLNTRFDIYDNVACPTGGACPASVNSIKDLLRSSTANGQNACRITNGGWEEPPEADRYLPTSATAPLATTVTPKAMGHPRDMCHAVASGTAGACAGPIGDGVWDRDAYFRSNYGWTASQWQTNTGLGSTASRYDVYKWEIANRGTTVGGQTVLGSRSPYGTGGGNGNGNGNGNGGGNNGGGSQLLSHGSPVCSSPQGYGTGTVPSTSVADRRRISVAVVNCLQNSVNGAATNVPVVEWLEVFLVEPSYNRSRTSAGDVYVEVIGVTPTGGGGGTAGQVVRRDVPYLVE